MKMVFAKIVATPRYVLPTNVVYCRYDELGEVLDDVSSNLQANIADSDITETEIKIEFMTMTQQEFDEFCEKEQVVEF